jgi:hypothetical protein
VREKAPKGNLRHAILATLRGDRKALDAAKIVKRLEGGPWNFRVGKTPFKSRVSNELQRMARVKVIRKVGRGLFRPLKGEDSG